MMNHLYFPINIPVTYISCGNLFHKGPWIHSERIIDSFVIIVGVKGIVYIQQDDEHYEVKPGCMLLLLPGHRHKGYKISDKEISFYWVHFMLKEHEIVNEQEANRIFRSSAYSERAQHALLPIFSSFDADSKIDILFRQLVHARKEPQYTSLAADYLLTSLIISLTHRHLIELKDSDSYKQGMQTFELITEWMKLNYSKDITAASVARQFNYNPNYFSKIFRERTGMSFTTYLNVLRINNAKVLLFQTSLRVNEIAYEVGFRDDKYFMRVFKKMEGLTPNQYRNSFYRTYMNDH
ncbi:MAG: AraC family transcriptional regulator [Anaerolineaceae bacterium]|nr:MAG: AraC family transcriptional regulator [Anaerolineaceae bacterium]